MLPVSFLSVLLVILVASQSPQGASIKEEPLNFQANALTHVFVCICIDVYCILGGSKIQHMYKPNIGAHGAISWIQFHMFEHSCLYEH